MQQINHPTVHCCDSFDGRDGTHIDSLHPFISFPELELKDQNLKDYQGSRYKHMVDLSQLARNNRGRGETIDNAVPTLTTNSGKLYSFAT